MAFDLILSWSEDYLHLLVERMQVAQAVMCVYCVVVCKHFPGLDMRVSKIINIDKEQKMS